MSEYKEFYRDENPMPENVGNDPVLRPYLPPGGLSGRPIGGSIYGDGGGKLWEMGEGLPLKESDGGGSSDGGGGKKPNEPVILWRTLITLSATVNAPNIIKHPKTGKILTYKGKCIKGFSATYTYIIQAGLIDEYAYHLDCVLMEFSANGGNYNESEQNEALTDFFDKGFLKGEVSNLKIRTKWQQGHWPPEITTIYFKIIDVKAEKESVDNIALTKEFRDTITMTIENGKMNFSKA